MCRCCRVREKPIFDVDLQNYDVRCSRPDSARRTLTRVAQVAAVVFALFCPLLVRCIPSKPKSLHLHNTYVSQFCLCFSNCLQSGSVLRLLSDQKACRNEENSWKFLFAIAQCPHGNTRQHQSTTNARNFSRQFPPIPPHKGPSSGISMQREQRAGRSIK